MLRDLVIFGTFFIWPSTVTAQWQLKFSDEFNGTSLDTSKWATQYTDGCHNNDEQECYQAANVTESGGLLHLTAKQQTVTSAGTTYYYTSGMIQSASSFSQAYGYFEMRAKIPKGQGFWPAFWTLPEDGNWPPEIDIIEIGKGGDFDTARMTLHWGTNGNDNYQENDWVSTDFSQAFHVFAVDWEPGRVTWYIDGVQRAQMVTSNVPSIPMYVLANLAVGGSWPGNVNSSTPLPSNMDIDYIRVWSKTSSTCYASIPSPTDPIPTTPCPSTSPDTQAPTVPTNLTANATSSSQISLSWAASTDNVAVAGYKVFRGGVQIGTATGLTYQDSGLTASTSYSYTVSAYDAAGNNSAQCSPVSATTNGVAPPPTVTALTCNPTTLSSGAGSTCAVTISSAASSGGAAVALSDNSSLLTTPASVTIAANATSASFNVTAGNVTASQAVTITASLNGSTKTTSINLTASPTITLTSLQCSPTTLASGTATSCSVGISSAAPTGGLAVVLSANNSLLTVPASVIVPAYATTASFSASCGTVPANQTAVISATVNSGSPVTLTLTLIPAAGTTYSIWSSTAKPANASASDSSSVELGVKFQASTAGSILGIRFYKGSKNTGTHIGYLWSRNGALLASATSSNETASGWQQVNFSSPVAITANTTYVAAYYTSSGYYSYDYNYFSNSSVTNGPLTALSDGADGPNGVYVYAKQTFPSNGYIGSNYWVDVVFVPSNPPAGTSSAVSVKMKTASHPATAGETSGAPLSCSPRVVPAGSSFNCELQLTDAAESEIAIDSSSYNIMVPAVVAPRANQHSLSFRGSVSDGAIQELATVSGVRAGHAAQDTVVTAAASSPVIHVPPKRLVRYGSFIGFRRQADSVDPVVLSIDRLPAGASFDASGNFAWTPSADQQGIYDLTFTAKGLTASSSKPMHLEVDAGVPVINRLSTAACSPGGIGSLTGKWLGPDEPVEDASGSSTELAGIRVRVNRTPVPVLHADQTHVSFICPRGTVGETLQIAVETPAGTTETLQSTMRAATPVLASTGTGSQGLIFLKGATQLAAVRDVRGAGLPAQPGDVLSIRAAGLGDNLPVTVKIGGASAKVLSIANAADAAGVSEIQVALPAAAGFGDAIEVHLEVAAPDGSQLESNTVTMAIEPVRQ